MKTSGCGKVFLLVAKANITIIIIIIHTWCRNLLTKGLLKIYNNVIVVNAHSDNQKCHESNMPLMLT